MSKQKPQREAGGILLRGRFDSMSRKKLGATEVCLSIPSLNDKKAPGMGLGRILGDRYRAIATLQ